MSQKVEVEIRVDTKDFASQMKSTQEALRQTVEDGETLTSTLGVGLVGGLLKANPSLAIFVTGLRDSYRALRSGISAVNEATSGSNLLTRSLVKLTAVPIVALLSALVIGLSGLVSWFKRTDEGSSKLTTAMSYLTQGIETVMDVASHLGEVLVTAFTKPMDAVRRLWEMIKNGPSTVNEFVNKSSERAKLMEEQRVLDERRTQFALKRARNEREIASLESKLASSSSSAAEKRKASQRIRELSVGLAEQELSLTKDQERITKRLNTLGAQNAETRKKNIEAEIETERALARVESARRRSNQRDSQLERSEASSRSKAAKAMKEEAARHAKFTSDEQSFQDDLRKVVLQAEDALEDARIVSIENHAARERAARKTQHERTLRDIKSQEDEVYKSIYEQRKKAWEHSHKDSPYENTDLGSLGWQGVKGSLLSADEKSLLSAVNLKINAQLNAEEVKYAREEELWYKELVKSYQSYTDQRLAIEKEYKDAVAEMEQGISDLRIKLQKATTDEERKQIEAQIGALIRSISEAGKLRVKGIADIATKEWQQSPSYSLAWSDLSRVPKETLADLKKNFEKLQDTITDPKSMDVVDKRIKALNNQIAKRNPFTVLKDALDDYNTAVKKSEGLRVSINNKQASISGLESVISFKESQGLDVTEDRIRLEQLKEELETLIHSLNGSMQEEADATELLNSSISKSVRLIDELASSLQQFGSQVGGSFGDTIGNIGSIFGQAGNAMTMLNKFKDAGEGFGGFLTKASSVVGLFTTLLSVNSTIDSFLPNAEQQYQKAAAKQAEINRLRMQALQVEIDMMERRQKAEHYFASTSLQQLKDNAEINKKNLEAYGAALEAPQEVYVEKSSGLKKWGPVIVGAIVGTVAGVLTAGAGAGLGLAVAAGLSASVSSYAASKVFADVIAPSIEALITDGLDGAFKAAIHGASQYFTYDNGQVEAKNNLRVQTRHASFWRGQKTQDLESWVRDNWGQELWQEVRGVELINLDVAHKLLEGDVAMVGETRETVAELVEYAEKAYEFLDNIKEYVNEAFGPLSDNLVSALWDWYENGTDVLDNFKDYASDTFKKIGQEVLKTMLNTLIFDKWKEEFENAAILYSTGKLGEGEEADLAYLALVTRLSGQMMDDVEGKVPTLENATTIIVEAFNSIGVSIASAKDSVDENIGEIVNTFREGLLDMEDDAQDFGKRIKKILYEALLKRYVMESPITVSVAGDDRVFENLDSYLESWQERVAAVLSSETLSDAGRTSQLAELNKELEDTLALEKQRAKTYADMAGWTMEDQIDSSVFSKVGDELLSVLKDSSRSVDDWKKDIIASMASELIDEVVYSEDYEQAIRSLQEQYVNAMSMSGDAFSGLSDEEKLKKREALLLEIADAMARLASDTQDRVDAINESLGNIDSPTFEGLADALQSSLTNMQGNAEGFGKEMVQNMSRQMIEALLNEKYGDRMKELGKEWADALSSGDADRIGELRDALMQLYLTIEGDESLLKLRKEFEDIATTPFDDFRSTYLSALMDMEKDTEDFVKDIGQLMAEDFVDKLVLGDSFDSKLEAWRKRYLDITGDSNLSEEQRMKQLNALSAAIADERNSMRQETENILHMLGLGQREDQGATMNMAETATYDQFELYLGMATSQLMVSEQQKALQEQILTYLRTTGGLFHEGGNYGEQLFMRLGTTNEYLLSIKKSVEGLYSDFGERMDTIIASVSKL